MAKSRTEITTFTGVLSGLGIAAATLIATVGKQPLSNPWFILFTVVAAASGLVFILAGLAPLLGWVRLVLKTHRKPKPLILDRWQYTSDGSEAAASAAAMEVSLPGTSGTKPSLKDGPPPWVRFAVTMACSEVDPHHDPDSDYRRFESFLLEDDLVAKMIGLLTGQTGKHSWSQRSAGGPGIHDAVFALGNNPSIVSARLRLPRTVQRNGSDSRCATLILHIQRSSPLWGLSAQQPPNHWERHVQRALELAIPVARLLTDLGFRTSGKPPAQVGIRLQAPKDLAEMVDITGRAEVPGETRGRQATGYFIADGDGKPTEAAAGTMVRDILLHALKTTDVKPPV